MSQKRIRSINWDEEEKQLFRSVLKEYASIIENKSLDTNTNKVKNKAWEELHKKFNELNSRPRELSQLKIQWKTMKINARKSYSTYKTKTNKTGGGARPPSPTDAVIEIKDLLNPAELLRDQNIYDSDGTILSSSANGDALESTSETCAITLQESKPTSIVIALDTCENDIIVENQHTMCVETIEDIDKQADHQKCTVTEVCEDNTILATPIRKNIISVSAKTTNRKRKIISNNTSETGSKSRKDYNDYASSMISHSKMLKDEEHMRRMEMAEEEHSIKMAIQKEKLKCVILEREILELKRTCEEKNICD